MKYEEWLDQWLNYYVKPSVKEKTFINYSIIVRIHLAPHLGKYELSELTLPVLQGFIVELSRSGNARTGGGLSASTLGTIISVIQKSLRFAVDIGMVETQYANRIIRPKIVTKETACFTLVEQKKIEAEILRAPHNKKIGILICLYTGLRIGELMALKWSDIDMKKGTISVNATCRDFYENGRCIKILDTPKTVSSRRVIPMPRQLIPYLRALKKVSKYEYVISNPDGECSVRGYQKIFSAMLRRLKIEHRGFHALRHTFATRALECGMDVKTLSEILGHKNPNITLNRYAHSMMEHKIAMMNRVGRILK